ncbi:hypothetical protein ABZ953_39105 [Streptomyces sp. NPDC046465]|uniref:hypothetical protein n=1 Tax=Streptomyces sp. NPDC046465 TaxID=3155810 RepID=UPI0034093760
MRRVELTGQADAVMEALPDDVHEEVLAIIDSVTDAPGADRTDPTEAFGTASWVTCRARYDVVEVLDVGWAG